MRVSTIHQMVAQERVIQDYYDLGSRIGGGGEANVYRALHKETGQFWAVKATRLREFRVAGQLPAHLPRDLYSRVSMPLRDVQSARSTK